MSTATSSSGTSTSPSGTAAASGGRVAVLGGGPAGLAAAFQLSAPGWEQRFESITVYQQGFRLGGKGASGARKIGKSPGKVRGPRRLAV